MLNLVTFLYTSILQSTVDEQLFVSCVFFFLFTDNNQITVCVTDSISCVFEDGLFQPMLATRQEPSQTRPLADNFP